jgi:hypothetical protein
VAPIIAALGKRAAEYHVGGLKLTVAAALVVDEAINTGKVNYPGLCAQVRRLGQLDGYALFYLPVWQRGDLVYRHLKGFSLHELWEDDTANIKRCARLMIRIEAIRYLLKKKDRVRPRDAKHSPCKIPAQGIADHLTIKEIGLWGVGRLSQAPELLRQYLESCDVTHHSLYEELIGRGQEIEGVVYTYPDGTTCTLRELMYGCRSDSFTLIESIAATLVRYYGDRMLDWDDNDKFATTWISWGELRKMIRSLWGGK